MTFVKFYTDPGFDTIINELDRASESLWSKPANGNRQAKTAWQPQVDIVETDDHYELSAEVPGLGKEDIAIEFEKDVLKISGERKPSEAKGIIRSERRFGHFERAFTVKTPVDAEKISATYKNGILFLTLPKSEEAKPKSIKIS